MSKSLNSLGTGVSSRTLGKVLKDLGVSSKNRLVIGDLSQFLWLKRSIKLGFGGGGHVTESLSEHEKDLEESARNCQHWKPMVRAAGNGTNTCPDCSQQSLLWQGSFAALDSCLNSGHRLYGLKASSAPCSLICKELYASVSASIK